MADYESRVIRGWRGKLEDVAAELRRGVGRDQSFVRADTPGSGPGGGGSKRCTGCFENEVALARRTLHELRLLKRRVRRAEQTSEQREEERAAKREWYAAQSPEWHAEVNRKRRAQVARKPEVYKAIKTRHYAKHRSEIIKQRRDERHSNLAEVHKKEQAYYEANKERLCAYKAEWRAQKRVAAAAANVQYAMTIRFPRPLPQWLTAGEIDALCRPLTQRHAQARWLSAILGVQLQRGPDGVPLVSRKFAWKVLGYAQWDRAPKDKAGNYARIQLHPKV